MSSKYPIDQIVSVDEQAIECDEEKQFDVVEETPELRPSVEHTIQRKVDTNHLDGVGRGLTLAAEERMVARETKSHERVSGGIDHRIRSEKHSVGEWRKR